MSNDKLKAVMFDTVCELLKNGCESIWSPDGDAYALKSMSYMTGAIEALKSTLNTAMTIMIVNLHSEKKLHRLSRSFCQRWQNDTNLRTYAKCYQFAYFAHSCETRNQIIACV